MKELRLEYELTKVTSAQVAREIDRLWDELSHSGQLRTEAENAGFDFTGLDAKALSKSVRVELSGHGIDPASVGIIVVLALPFAKAGAKLTETVLRDVWTKIIFPRLVQRLGKGAVVEKENSVDRNKSKSLKKARRKT